MDDDKQEANKSSNSSKNTLHITFVCSKYMVCVVHDNAIDI